MKNLLTILILLIGGVTIGQNDFCGTTYDKSMRDRLIENKKAFFEGVDYRSVNSDWTFIPIQFHIVTDKDGKGGIDPSKIVDELCHLNNNYAPHKMKFYLNGDFNYIKSSKLYSEPSHAFAVSKIKSAKKKFPKAINMFIVNVIPNTSGGPGRTLGYFTPAYDVLVVRKSQFGVKAQTVSHELGHFFSLAHPFNGWESDPYDATKHGNPLTILKTSIGRSIEFMDKSNCESTADLICDTPPDYNFGISDDGDCKLNGPILDYHKDTINTMENNYMGYFFNCGDYEFTPMQVSAMKADFNSNKRKFLRSDYIPDTSHVTGEDLVVVYPKENETTEFYDHINLDWEDVPGANNYIVKIGLKTQLYKAKYYYVHGKSELLITDLEKGKRYTWFVRPYNEGNGCSKLFKASNFKAGAWATGIDELGNNNSISVYPNPISNKEFYIESDKDLGNVVLKIVNIEGREIESLSVNLVKGKNKLNLTHSNYQKGLYSFIIDSKDKKYIRKVIVE